MKSRNQEKKAGDRDINRYSVSISLNRQSSIKDPLKLTLASFSPKTSELGLVDFHLTHLRHQLRKHAIKYRDHARLLRRMSMHRGSCCQNDTILHIDRTMREGGY